MEGPHYIDVEIHQPSPSDRFRVRVEQDKENHKRADSSAPLFAMYSQMAEKEDKEMAERWRNDADGIIIFTGLFSAAVAVLVSVTVLDLKQPLSPSNYVIWVNSLWSLSLTISLTCALLATILQQCARRYLRITQRPQYSPHDRARTRAFFARGVELMRFSWMVEAIPALIHISLFLFFSGLLIYLFNINHIAFYAVAGWIAAFAVAYLVITFMPILRLDSPYHAPLSPLAFWVYGAVSYSIFFVLPRLVPLKDMTWQYFQDLADGYFAGCSQGIEKVAEVHARKPSPDIDGFILKWTFDANSMASDNQLDRFFECLLAFNGSDQVVPDPRRSLAKLSFREFGSAMVAFLDRTLTSSSVTNSVKVEQLIKCVEVADVTHVTILLDRLSEAAVQNVVQTVEVGRTLRRRNNDEEIGLCAQTIIADIIAKAPQRDDIWITLAADQLGKSQDDIREYLKHGNDNVLLANLIHITRQIFKSSSGITRDMAGNAASYILRPPSEFDIRNTLPVLQHDFCALWNDIVITAQQRGDSSIPHFILYLIRRHFIDLHQDMDSASTSTFDDFKVSSYPSCNNPHHRPAETAATTLATWNHAHTNSRTRNTPSPNGVSGAQTTTISPIPPESSTIPLRSRPTAPHHVTTSTSHSLSVPVMPSAPVTGDLPSADSFMNESGHLSRGRASSSSPIAAFPPIDLQVAPSDPSDCTTIATSRVHEDTYDRNVSSQLGLPRYAHQSELSTPDVVLNHSGTCSP